MNAKKPSFSSSYDGIQSKSVFISYAKEDFDEAKKLYAELRAAGLDPWLDKESLLAGTNWQRGIKNAIDNSMYFIPLLSSNSVKARGFVQKEFKFALEKLEEIPESDIFVIPARLDDCNIPYDKLKDLHYIDLFPSWEKGIEKILQTTGMMEEIGKFGANPIAKILKDKEVMEQSKKYMQKVQINMDLCFGSTVPSILAHMDVYREGYKDILKRGAKIRLITEITKGNLHFCKDVKEWVTELRHLKGVKCAFAVSENQYIAISSYVKGNETPFNDAYYNDADKQLIKYCQDVFDTMWENAISSEQRIDEIENYLKRCIKKIDNSSIKNANNLYNKALFLNSLGNYEEALECVSKGLDLDPSNSKILDTKGEILSNLKRYTESMEYFRKSLCIDPYNMGAKNHMTLDRFNVLF